METCAKGTHSVQHDPRIALASATRNTTRISFQPSLILALAAESAGWS